MLLEILQPIVPISMQSFVTKYNIPNRMWSNAFHHCLEVLRRGGHKSSLALEHMHEFIIYGYGFYQALYERSSHESSLWAAYKGFWLEALGDLAQYRMAISQRPVHAFAGAPLTADNLASVAAVARIDDTPPPSIGLEAARLFDLEPEREIWRKNARSWYASALKDVPGTGRLLHHLGLLCREVPDEELRGVFHFVKRCVCLTLSQPRIFFLTWHS
jgi:protein SMG6